MEGLKVLKGCGEIHLFLTQNNNNVYSLVIRQAQWNTTLQKHTNINLETTILCYPHKVAL